MAGKDVRRGRAGLWVRWTRSRAMDWFFAGSLVFCSSVVCGYVGVRTVGGDFEQQVWESMRMTAGAATMAMVLMPALWMAFVSVLWWIDRRRVASGVVLISDRVIYRRSVEGRRVRIVKDAVRCFWIGRFSIDFYGAGQHVRLPLEVFWGEAKRAEIREQVREAVGPELVESSRMGMTFVDAGLGKRVKRVGRFSLRLALVVLVVGVVMAAGVQYVRSTPNLWQNWMLYVLAIWPSVAMVCVVIGLVTHYQSWIDKKGEK